jgi:chemotaxis protein MotB
VAYADFTTAMMALFLLLWLAAQDQKIKEAIERAFRNPFMSLTKESSGLLPNKNNPAGSGSGKYDNATASVAELALLRRVQDELAKSLKLPEDEQNEESVQFNLTPEGLRINIFDRSRKPIFEPHSDKLTEYGTWILTTLAWEISRYETFMVELEGHTEKDYPPVTPAYGKWELSADRANAGRRKLLEYGVRAQQVKKVAGFADTSPLPGLAPDHPNNRRIALLLRVNTNKDTKA